MELLIKQACHGELQTTPPFRLFEASVILSIAAHLNHNTDFTILTDLTQRIFRVI